MNGIERASLLVALATLLAGYVGVYRPLEAETAQRYERLDDARRLLAGHLARAKRIASLAENERALHIWLSRVGIERSRPEVANAFLRIIATTARAHDTHITTIAERNVRQMTPAGPGAFDELPLTLSCQGTYRHLLHFVRDLDAAMPAARIAIETLERADHRRSNEPDLRATMSVVLLRERIADPKETHASV